MEEYNEFIDDFKRMCELYKVNRYVQSDELMRELSERMDDIRRLELDFETN